MKFPTPVTSVKCTKLNDHPFNVVSTWQCFDVIVEAKGALHKLSYYKAILNVFDGKSKPLTGQVKPNEKRIGLVNESLDVISGTWKELDPSTGVTAPP